MRKIRIALIADNNCIAKWQQEALEEVEDLVNVELILNCKNTRTKKKIFKNFFYYILNVVSLRNHKTKKVKFSTGSENVVDFECDYEGAWQSIPSAIVKQLHDNQIDLIVKFGMSLLRIDEDLSEMPILSYHHGDPSKYRGRPAGFYELLNNEEKSGVIVQRLSNVLDAGEIYAFAEAKLDHHSYKKSAVNFYSISRFLLRKAIINLQNKNNISIATNGRNYRLPSNSKVLDFLLALLIRKLKRLVYGALFEKRWKIGTCPIPSDFESDITVDSSQIDVVPIDHQYTFYADPFFSVNGKKIRLEALNAKSGLGDIIELDVSQRCHHRVVFSGEHYSYPFPFSLDDDEYILPEVASHSAQYFTNLVSSNPNKIYLKGLESKRIVDATLFEFNGIFYLFFGENKDSVNVLNLYVAKQLDGEFRRHPQNPICVDPSSARMGGRVFMFNDKIYRFGQNSCRGYGSSISVMCITKLSEKDFEENLCGSINIAQYKGPHTIDLNCHNDLLLIDFYSEKCSLFAGYRRLLAKLAKK